MLQSVVVQAQSDVQPFTIQRVDAPIRYGGLSSNAEITSHGQATYIAYADTDFTLTVARYDEISGEWTRATHIDNTIGRNDSSHNQMSLAVDGDGYIHVWYGMHDKEGMRYARSNSANSVTAGFTVRSYEFPNARSQYTYPHAISAPNGDIYFSIRRDGRFLPLFHWNHTLNFWSEVAVFADGTAAMNDGQIYTPYLPWLYADSLGNIHIKWDWAFGTARSERHHGSYALYEPRSGRFYRANGRAYALPITVPTSDVFQPLGAPDITWDEEGIALSDLAVDNQNRPIITYAFSPDGSAERWEHRAARWDGTRWIVTTLTDQTRKWNKNFLVSAWGLLYYYAKTDAGTEVWWSGDDGANWSAASLIHDRSIDGAVLAGNASAARKNTHILLHLSSAGGRVNSELSIITYGDGG